MTNTNFTQQQKNTDNKYLTKLWQTATKNQDQETQNLLIEFNQTKKELYERENQYIQFNGITRQRFQNHLAGDLALTDQRFIWFLYHSITIITATEEFDTLLKKTYGTQYTALKNRIIQLGIPIEELKYHYDMMEQNPSDTKKYAYHNEQVCKKLIKLPLINPDLNQLIHLISTKTELGNYTISQTIIGRLLQKYKKADLPEERKTRPEPTMEGG
jgi:hypothetical protein